MNEFRLKARPGGRIRTRALPVQAGRSPLSFSRKGPTLSHLGGANSRPKTASVFHSPRRS